MIDLTPLDVRNKRGDFRKGMRGYDPQEVDVFLELVAERLEALVRENIQLRDRTQTLQEQVNAQAGREQAVQDALVTAQELRKDIREQSQREADHVMKEAESEARRMIAEAEAEVRSRLRGVERRVEQARDSLEEMERRRQRFLQEFRGLLQREMDVIEVEEERAPPTPPVAPPSTPDDEEVEVGVADEAAGDEGHGAEEGTPGAETDVEPTAEIDRGEDLKTEAAETTESTQPVDVADLQPGPAEEEPSSLELELMAGAVTDDSDDARPGYPEVPDLETVLAEAGMDDADPPVREEISPPPAERRPPDLDGLRPEDRLAFFDRDRKGKKG